jgi:hypothetical protein
MNYSRATTLEYLARIKGMQPNALNFRAESYQRLAAAALGAFGVLIAAATIVSMIS